MPKKSKKTKASALKMIVSKIWYGVPLLLGRYDTIKDYIQKPSEIIADAKTGIEWAHHGVDWVVAHNDPNTVPCEHPKSFEISPAQSVDVLAVAVAAVLDDPPLNPMGMRMVQMNVHAHVTYPYHVHQQRPPVHPEFLAGLS